MSLRIVNGAVAVAGNISGLKRAQATRSARVAGRRHSAADGM
jgi:hypothetical protein